MVGFRRTLLTAMLSVMWPVALAGAQSLTIQSVVTLQGFTNPNVGTAFITTNPDSWHWCSVGVGSTCTATNGYSHPPKNVHEYLCVAQTFTYQITSGCSSLLAQGGNQKCHKNSTRNPVGCSPGKTIGPACQWTTASSGTATWRWTITAQTVPNQAPYLLDCSNAGYVGPH
jgi:hypothetical protein